MPARVIFPEMQREMKCKMQSSQSILHDLFPEIPRKPLKNKVALLLQEPFQVRSAGKPHQTP